MNRNGYEGSIPFTRSLFRHPKYPLKPFLLCFSGFLVFGVQVAVKCHEKFSRLHLFYFDATHPELLAALSSDTPLGFAE